MHKFPLNIPFHLFSCCFLVKGYQRSCIYDVQRGDFNYIPNTLVDILEECINCTFMDLLNIYNDPEDQSVLYEYFEMLYDNEYIFFSEIENIHFPVYNKDFFKPYNISTLVIDICDFNKDFIDILIRNICEVKVECIVLRAINLSYSDIEKTISSFNDISTRIIQLFVSKEVSLVEDDVENLFIANNRLSLVIKVDVDEREDVFKRGVFVRTKIDIMDKNDKELSVSDFIPNMDLYFESLTFNAFYHKRVYIDTFGNVLRHEKDDIKFGNIKNLMLVDIIKYKNFDFFWRSNKDEISVCKDCEYRYMCGDHRLPIYNKKKKEWSFENKCNYNPYLAEWSVNS